MAGDCLPDLPPSDGRVTFKSEESQKPQPLLVSKKALLFTSNLYGSTPPPHLYRCAFLASKPGRKRNSTVHLPFVLQHASFLYGSTLLIRTAVLLRKYWGVGVTGKFLIQDLRTCFTILAGVAISAATYRGAKCLTLKTAEKQPKRVPSGSR